MSDLVERYIHEVGRYLPSKERAEIEAELRSQIRDKLDDRYGGAATPDDVAAVLAELGQPRKMAASYGSEQYLIGPELYQVMMMVLRRGWVLVPIVVVIVHVVLALFAESETTLIELLLDTVFGAIQSILIFSGIVVLLFAVIQHSGEDLEEFTGAEKEFDPHALPEVDAPGRVDRFEAAFGIAISAFVTIILLYYLRVGGLTLHFDLSDPGEVIPVPIPWLILLILNTIALLIVNLMALQRNRWTVATQLLEIGLETFGALCVYFAVFEPLAAFALTAVPALANVPFIERAPEIILAVSVVATLIGGASKLLKMWNYRDDALSFNVKSGS